MRLSRRFSNDQSVALCEEWLVFLFYLLKGRNNLYLRLRTTIQSSYPTLKIRIKKLLMPLLK